MYSVPTSAAVSARGYACTLAIEPLKYEAMLSLYLIRPMTNGPVAANGVVSVAVPEAAPLTYNVIAPLLASNTPTRCVHAPTVGAAVDLARVTAALGVSEATSVNAHRLSAKSYWRSNPALCTASWETAVSK